MAAKLMPITGDVLAWAIADAGLSVDEVAHRASVSLPQVESWLAGDDKPTTGELNRVAKVLGRAPSFFLRPRPPTKANASVSLRVPYGERGERSLTPEERVHIRRALRRQKIARWASTVSQDFQTPKLPPIGDSPEAAADGAREWLSWSVRDQFKATSKAAVTRELRRRLESKGILVIQLSMGEDACRGISVHDSRVPLIVFNSSEQTAAARSFTMLHELAHLMHGEDVVCGGADTEHERWCDRFAAAFLMPATEFIEFLSLRVGLTYVGPTDVATVKKLSDRFKTSWQSVALRLWQTKSASYSLFEHVRDNRLEDGPGFARGGAKTPEVRLREYGTGYARLLLEAYDADALSEVDLRKYLDVNGEQLSEIVSLTSGAH